jgi:hypothetical protein
MERKRVAKIALVAILVVLLFAVVAGPALATLWSWEQPYQSHGVTIDTYDRAQYVYGGYSWTHLGPDATQVFGKTLECSGWYSERVFVWSRPDGVVKIFGGCAIMTPTPAPTQQP